MPPHRSFLIAPLAHARDTRIIINSTPIPTPLVAQTPTRSPQSPIFTPEQGPRITLILPEGWTCIVERGGRWLSIAAQEEFTSIILADRLMSFFRLKYFSISIHIERWIIQERIRSMGNRDTEGRLSCQPFGVNGWWTNNSIRSWLSDKKRITTIG